MNDSERRSGKSNAAIVGLLLVGLLLPVLYLLGLGPAIWLGHNGYVDSWFVVMYLPVEWLYDACPPLRPVIDWYADFWR